MLTQMKISELMNDRSRQSSEQALYDVIGCAACALLLVMFGLTMLYSTTSAVVGETLFRKQLFWAVGALVAMGGVVLVGAAGSGARKWCLP